MGQWRRVFYNGSVLIAVEHRADESTLGTNAYTDANVPSRWSGVTWFISPVSAFWTGGVIRPWASLSVGQSAENRPEIRSA